MSISIFELFSIGVGPSSSHTIGPMRAAYKFLQAAKNLIAENKNCQIITDLYGSLALTGKGHGTDYAVIMGLEGNLPESINIEKSHQQFPLLQKKYTINFHYDKFLDYHANGMKFTLINHNNEILLKNFYYSIGGGFIIDEDEKNNQSEEKAIPELAKKVKYDFNNARELLQICSQHNLSIAEVLWENELAWNDKQQIKENLLKIWQVMNNSIERGINQDGILPGGLNVKRRAKKIYDNILKKADNAKEMDWLSLYAIAVNEENAAFGRVVTAPTNGAAGTIPAVLKYFLKEQNFKNKDEKEQAICDFLLTAGAIGMLYKKGASISAAEVGCQGEVGVACSMAAAAYAALNGADIKQIANAAEIGMEHNLGLTCDPINGLVQIPCIERNAMGAIQAVNAARLALLGDGCHHVSLDKVIRTMLQTGKDMSKPYKETSQGGLAIHLPEC